MHRRVPAATCALVPKADVSVWKTQPVETDPGHEIRERHQVPFPEIPRNPSRRLLLPRNRSLLSGDLEEIPPLQNTLPWSCQEKPTTSTQLKPMPQTTAFHHPTLSEPPAGLEVEPTSSKVPLGQTLATPGLALPSVHQGNASPAIPTSRDLASHLAWSPLEGDNTVPGLLRSRQESVSFL